MLLDFINKGGTYNIDGRIVKIKCFRKYYNETAKKIISFILSYCKEEKLAKKFPVVEFILEKTQLVDIALLKFNLESDMYFSVADNSIHIMLDVIEKTEISEKQIIQTLNHELTHFLHKTISNMGKGQAMLEKLNQNVSQFSKKANPNTQEHALALLRLEIGRMFSRFVGEGAAYYNTFFASRNFSFSSDYFDRVYVESYQHATKLRQDLKEIYQESQNIKKLNFEKISELIAEFRMCEGVIGYHMFYTIIYTNQKGLDFEKLVEISYIEFIKVYEECIQKTHHLPIVSFTSRKGVLDYSRMLKEWKEKFKYVEND